MPSAAYNWNVMKTLAAFPCAQPDPVILALTFLPAVAPALLEYIQFGCRDIIKFRLGKGTPCGRQMAAQVAKAIPPKFTSAVNNLLKWEHRFSTAGQVFLIADLVGDTLARWDTLAYQLSGCPDALDIKTWDIEPNGFEALVPGVPTPLGGLVVNERGPPGIAWPNGAIVPKDWYWQTHFTVDVRPFTGAASPHLTTWIAEHGRGPYDFPGNQFQPGYGGSTTHGHYTLTTQNTDQTGSRQYVYYGMTDTFAVADNFKATAQASRFPPSSFSLNNLGCLQDLTVEHVEDPAGRNNASRYPGVIDKLAQIGQGKPVWGPPKGKPRAKK